MSLGSGAFKVAIASLIPLIASLFLFDTKWGWLFLLVGLLALILAFTFETIVRPSKNKLWIFIYGILILSLVGGILKLIYIFF